MKLNECFETIRQEFDALAHDLVHVRSQRDDLDNKGMSFSPATSSFFPNYPIKSHLCISQPIKSLFHYLYAAI